MSEFTQLALWFDGVPPTLRLLLVMGLLIICMPGEIVVLLGVCFAITPGMHPALVIVNAALVVLAAAIGSTLNNVLVYGFSRLVGRPLVLRFGRYVLLSERKLQLAEDWVLHYGAAGIFFAPFLPVIRRLVAIPAGVVCMPFRRYVAMCGLGALLWCTVPAVLSIQMADDLRLVLLQGTEAPAFRAAFTTVSLTIAGLVAISLTGYIIMMLRKRRLPSVTVEETV